jgi:hypothetical protein
VAQKLRKLGGKVPPSCSIHTPSCLLREAALTREEVLVKSFIACHKLSDVANMEQNLEKELRDAGILGETAGDAAGDATGEAAGSTHLFVAHPYKYFHFLGGGGFPENFGSQRVERTRLFWHSETEAERAQRGIAGEILLGILLGIVIRIAMRIVRAQGDYIAWRIKVAWDGLREETPDITRQHSNRRWLQYIANGNLKPTTATSRTSPKLRPNTPSE